MTKGRISNFADEAGEVFKDAGLAAAREIGDMGRIAKKQIIGQGSQGDQVLAGNDQVEAGSKQVKEQDGKKVDPVTGRPMATKVQLTDLKNKVAQLQLAKLKRIREELDKQKLKVSEEQAKLASLKAAEKQGIGPSMPGESAEKQSRDDAVAKTLKGSKSTGEFKGLIGG